MLDEILTHLLITHEPFVIPLIGFIGFVFIKGGRL